MYKNTSRRLWGRLMSSFNFKEIEAELDLVVPDIFRMFISAAFSKELSLKEYGLYFDSESLIKGNLTTRASLTDGDPSWKNHYLDIGVGDGCGNRFFLTAKSEDDDKAKLWAHDPAGIEDAGSATEFLMNLLSVIEAGFKGEYQYYYQGTLDTGNA